MWEFLDRCDANVRLQAVAKGERIEVTDRVRNAFSDAGAWITDVHFFSGLETVFAFEVASSRLRSLIEALGLAGLVFRKVNQAPSPKVATALPPEVHGTLSVLFVDGDLDLKREVPAVPG